VAEQRRIHPRRRARGHRSLCRDIRPQDVGAVGERGGWLHRRRNRAVKRRSGLGPRWFGALGTLAGDPCQQAIGNAEEQLVGDSERGGDLLAQRRGQRASGRAPHELAEHETERQRVVARRLARLPPRRLVGDEGTHPVPVAQIPGRDVRPQPRHAGGVHKHVA
jgi:hypothetical protein